MLAECDAVVTWPFGWWCRKNEALIEKLSVPAEGSEPLKFDSEYPQGYLSQFTKCLWKCATNPSPPPPSRSFRLGLRVQQIACAALLWTEQCLFLGILPTRTFLSCDRLDRG